MSSITISLPAPLDPSQVAQLRSTLADIALKLEITASLGSHAGQGSIGQLLIKMARQPDRVIKALEYLRPVDYPEGWLSAWELAELFQCLIDQAVKAAEVAGWSRAGAQDWNGDELFVPPAK